MPLTQAIVTCNCEYKDEPAWASGAEPPAGNWGRAPPPEAFAGFVQDCTGPGAPVIIEIALSATIASTRSVEFLCQPPLVLHTQFSSFFRRSSQFLFPKIAGRMAFYKDTCVT